MNRTIEEEILIEISGLKTHIQVDVVYNFFLSITFPTKVVLFLDPATRSVSAYLLFRVAPI